MATDEPGNKRPGNKHSHLVPWRTAGSVSEAWITGDEVVRDTGWVFNNEVGDLLTLDQFVASGDAEVKLYMDRFGMRADNPRSQTLLEIGCGIGRMTSAFTREYDFVIGCDVDPAFLERCRQTVAQKGEVSRLRTSQVRDGHILQEGDDAADVVFSYITLQHCSHDDACDLVREAWRVVKPGGRLVLNFRTWVKKDVVLVPAGVLVRAIWRIPVIGKRLTGRRWTTRLGWQANRLGVAEVLELLPDVTDPVIWKHPRRKPTPTPNAQGRNHTTRDLDIANPSHWWFDARKPLALNNQ